MPHNITYRVTQVEQDYISRFLEETRLQVIGFGKWCETDTRALHNFTLSNFQLVFVQQGEAAVTHRGAETRCAQGSLFLYEPFETYSAKSVGTLPLVYYYLYFDVSPYAQRREFERRVFGEKEHFTCPGEYPSAGDMLFNLTHSEMRSAPGYYALLNMALTRLLIWLMQDRVRRGTAISSPTIPRKLFSLVNATVEYTEGHLNEPICVSEIAKQLNVSESSLYKAFLQTVQLSPSKFLTQYKVSKGEQLLQDSTLSLETIAEQLGYSSAFHFSRTFKSVLGRSPRAGGQHGSGP